MVFPWPKGSIPASFPLVPHPSLEDAVISREGLRNLTVEGQSASLALLGMMLGIGARAAMAGFLLGNGEMEKWRSDPESGVWKGNPEAKRLVGWLMNRETWGFNMVYVNI